MHEKSSMALTEIGIITRPQGLKGHFRVKSHYSNFSINIETVLIKNKEYKVEKITDRQKFFVFKLAELNSIEEVEALRNEKIFTNLAEEILAEDEFFVADLIGSNVFSDGENLGAIKNILQWGAADVFEVENAETGKSFMFPFARDVLISFDKDKKIVALDGKILQEIKVDN